MTQHRRTSARGVKLILKAADQKVDLAEVSIRRIREKIRATKASYTHTPYELFTGERIDHDRDFRCRWGELVIVKKP